MCFLTLSHKIAKRTYRLRVVRSARGIIAHNNLVNCFVRWHINHVTRVGGSGLPRTGFIPRLKACFLHTSRNFTQKESFLFFERRNIHTKGTTVYKKFFVEKIGRKIFRLPFKVRRFDLVRFEIGNLQSRFCQRKRDLCHRNFNRYENSCGTNWLQYASVT